MKNFYLLDGSGYLFRAYHALPELTNNEGRNVNAVYGFFRMLLKLFKERPDYFLLAWDHPKKTLREEAFADYKANRPEVADEFKRQIGRIKEIVERCSLPYLEIPGYEADDIIYTLNEYFKNEKNNNFYVISSDKDLKQLIDKNVYFYEPMKGNISGIQEFKEEYGFSPEKILDYLALLGDSSDNIPGVKGVGKKTAQELIQNYGTLENIYENLDEISGSLKGKLEEGKETAFKGRELIRLYDVPGLDKAPMEDFSLEPDIEELEKILVEEWNFKSMQKVIDAVKQQYKGGQQPSLF